MKFAVTIILYNPSIDNIKLIDNYKCFDYIYIIDNSDNSMNLSFDKKKYRYLKNEENLGVSKSINLAIEFAIKDNVDYLCTMDQDSCFTENNIKKIINYIENNDMRKIGIVSPFISYSNDYLPENNDVVFKRVKWVITSGSFINMNILKQKKYRYDENLFIDRCDIDFCFQINKYYDILIIKNSILYQRLGEPGKNNRTSHSYMRHYYMFRNRLYFNKKWYNFFKGFCLSFFQTIKHFYLIFRNEDNKKLKYKMFFYAFRDFKKEKMGRKF